MSDESETPIAAKLRELIKAQTDSLKVLATKTGVPQPTLSRFLRGERDLTIETADKLVSYFGHRLEPCPSTSTSNPSKSTASGRKHPSP